ncbi:hypothetical protein [Nostoc sp.]|uniref:hypothetical protein n=1 Tax=Nostoc sp. TaxID=1180 RepID=UPI002FF9536A
MLLAVAGRLARAELGVSNYSPSSPLSSPTPHTLLSKSSVRPKWAFILFANWEKACPSNGQPFSREFFH